MAWNVGFEDEDENDDEDGWGRQIEVWLSIWRTRG